MIKNHEIRIKGQTKAIKEVLKSAGWTYDGAAKNWVKYVDDQTANALRGGDRDLLKSLGGRKKGCQVFLDHSPIYTSPTFAEAAPNRGGNVFAGDLYAADAAGNLVPGKQIPGSAPDDRI